MAYCLNCGTAINVNESLCPSCHSIVPPQPDFSGLRSEPQTPLAYGSPAYGMPPNFVHRQAPPRRGVLGIVLLTFAATLLVVGFIAFFVAREVIGGVAAEAATELAQAKNDVQKAKNDAQIAMNQAQKGKEITKIELVYGADDAMSKLLKSGSEELRGDEGDKADREAELISDFLTIAMSADTKGCPANFVEDRKEYVSAISDLAQVLRAHPLITSGDSQATIDWRGRVYAARQRKEQAGPKYVDTFKSDVASIEKSDSASE